MSLQDLLTEQVLAFHTAILDSCRRSVVLEQTDTMALRLRANALSMTRLQLAMIALAGAGPPGQEPDPPGSLSAETVQADPGSTEAVMAEAVVAEAVVADGVTPEAEDHLLTGDALSRFISSRIAPGESMQSVWQRSLREGDDATQRYPVQASGYRARDVNARIALDTGPP